MEAFISALRRAIREDEFKIQQEHIEIVGEAFQQA